MVGWTLHISSAWNLKHVDSTIQNVETYPTQLEGFTVFNGFELPEKMNYLERSWPQTYLFQPKEGSPSASNKSLQTLDFL